MGYTLVKNNTYYSLFGRKLPYGVSGGKPSLGILYEKIDKMIITYTINPVNNEGSSNKVSMYISGSNHGLYSFHYDGLTFNSTSITEHAGVLSGTTFRIVDEDNSMGYITHFPTTKDLRGGYLGNQSFSDYWLIISNGRGLDDGLDLVRIRFDNENATKFIKMYNNLFSKNYEIK